MFYFQYDLFGGCQVLWLGAASQISEKTHSYEDSKGQTFLCLDDSPTLF